MANNRSFFAKPKPHSIVKMDIVAKYFVAWANIMKSRCDGGSLTYLDLCSGQGIYDDGTPATPLRVLSNALEIPALRDLLRVYFYEKEKKFHSKLDEQVSSHQASQWLVHKPVVKQKEVSEAIVPSLPIDQCTFCFIDPHGYKGISLRLLAAVLDNWGSDCLFYFSTAGLRRNLERREQMGQIVAIFGERGLDKLKSHVVRASDKGSFNRLALRLLWNALSRHQKPYFLPFGVEYERARLISHYLVFVSMHHRGYSIMKQIMAKHSLLDPAGIPYFRFSDMEQAAETQSQFLISERMEKLETELFGLVTAAGVTVKSLNETCDKYGMPYIPANVESALRNLEMKGKVSVVVPEGKTRPQGRILGAYKVWKR